MSFNRVIFGAGLLLSTLLSVGNGQAAVDCPGALFNKSSTYLDKSNDLSTRMLKLPYLDKKRCPIRRQIIVNYSQYLIFLKGDGYCLEQKSLHEKGKSHIATITEHNNDEIARQKKLCNE